MVTVEQSPSGCDHRGLHHRHNEAIDEGTILGLPVQWGVAYTYTRLLLQFQKVW